MVADLKSLTSTVCRILSLLRVEILTHKNQIGKAKVPSGCILVGMELTLDR